MMLPEKSTSASASTTSLWKRVLLWILLVWSVWNLIDLLLLVWDKYPSAYSRHQLRVAKASTDFHVTCQDRLADASRTDELNTFCSSRHSVSRWSPFSLAFGEVQQEWWAKHWMLSDWGCRAGTQCDHAFYNFVDKFSDSMLFIVPIVFVAMAFCLHSTFKFISWMSFLRYQEKIQATYKDRASPRPPPLLSSASSSSRRRYVIEYPDETDALTPSSFARAESPSDSNYWPAMGVTIRPH